MTNRPAGRTAIWLARALALIVATATAGCAHMRHENDDRPGPGGPDPRWLGVNYRQETLERDRPMPQKMGFFMLNRMLDSLDCFTLNVGFGPAMHAEIHLTDAMRLGAGGAYLASVGTGEAPREYGFFGRGVGEMAAGPFQMGVSHYEPFLATGRDFDDSYRAMMRPYDQIFRKKRDYWSFGVSAGFLIAGFEFQLHPLQFYDFMMGWAGKDPMQDDK